MALLQIAEPGQSPQPHQRRLAVGIDLGTTHSLVAAVRHGVAECLPDAQGRVLLPSAVRYLPGGRRAIGFDARAAQAAPGGVRDRGAAFELWRAEFPDQPVPLAGQYAACAHHQPAHDGGAARSRQGRGG